MTRFLTRLLPWLFGQEPRVLWLHPRVERSHHWASVRRAFLEGKTCAGCGGTEHLEAHHVLPVHLYPESELDSGNLIALCQAPGRNCHHRLGHGFDWHAYCPAVRYEAACSLRAIQTRRYDRPEDKAS